mgnify:FL=1
MIYFLRSTMGGLLTLVFTLSMPTLAGAQQSLIDKCVDTKIAAFKKEMGEDRTIRVDMLDEWEADCKQQLNKGKPTAPTPSATRSGAEVGDRLFVTSPKAKPIYISKSGTRYWPCNGLIAPNLIDVVYRDLAQIAQSEGIAPPSSSICHYKIGTFNAMGNSITTYTMDFYISQPNMETCVINDYCSDFRSMTFKIKNEVLHRQYFVSNVSKKINRMTCLEMSGKVVSAKGGC